MTELKNDMTRMKFINKSLQSVLLNAHSLDSLGLHNGKLGLSLCLFEVARCFNNDSIENTAFDLFQEVLALRNQGKVIKPIEIGFVLLYLKENGLIEADIDEIFGEDIERLQTSARVFAPYSELHVDFIPFLTLLWKLKKEDTVRQLIVEILDGATLSLKQQLTQMQGMRFLPNIQRWLNVFEGYLKAVSLFTEYTISSTLQNQYIALYQKERIQSRFITGFYMERFLKKNKRHDVAKTMQEVGALNVYPDIMTLAQRINLLYLLKQTEPLYKTQIQKLEKGLFDGNDAIYEKRIIQMIPFDKLTVGYEGGLARLLLYWVYKENLQNKQDSSRFRYIFKK